MDRNEEGLVERARDIIGGLLDLGFQATLVERARAWLTEAEARSAAGSCDDHCDMGAGSRAQSFRAADLSGAHQPPGRLTVADLGFIERADVPVDRMRRSIHESNRAEGHNFTD